MIQNLAKILGFGKVKTPIIDSEIFRDDKLLYQISNYSDARDLLKNFHLKVQAEEEKGTLDKEGLEKALINPLIGEARRGYQETIIKQKYQYEYDQETLQYGNFLTRNAHRELINSKNSDRKVESPNCIAYGIEKGVFTRKERKELIKYMQVSLGFFMEHYSRDEPSIIAKRLLTHHEPYEKELWPGKMGFTICCYADNMWGSPSEYKEMLDNHERYMSAIKSGEEFIKTCKWRIKASFAASR